MTFLQVSKVFALLFSGLEFIRGSCVCLQTVILHSALFLASRTHAVSSYLAAQKATTFVFGPSSLSDSQEHEEK